MHEIKMLLFVMSFINAVIGSINIQSDRGDLHIIVEDSNGQQQTLVNTKQQNKNIYELSQTATLDAKVKSFRQYLMSKLSNVKSRRSKRKLSGNTVHSCTVYTFTQKVILNSCKKEVVLQGCSGSCPAGDYFYYHCRPTQQKQIEVKFDCDLNNVISIKIGSATHCKCMREQRTVVGGFKK